MSQESRKKLAQQRAKENQPFYKKPIFIIVVLIVLLVIGYGVFSKKTSFDPYQHASLQKFNGAVLEEYKKMPQDMALQFSLQKHTEVEMHRVFDRLQGVSVVFDSAYANLKNNGFYTIPVGPRMTQFVSMDSTVLDLVKNPMRQEIVIMPLKFKEYMPSPAFCDEEGTYRVSEALQTETALAEIGVHELIHGWQYLRHGRSFPQAGYSNREAEAYLVEMLMMKHADADRYDYLISKGQGVVDSKDINKMTTFVDGLYNLSSLNEDEAALLRAGRILAIYFEGAISKENPQTWQDSVRVCGAEYDRVAPFFMSMHNN